MQSSASRKVTKLSVHKNNKEQRKQKEVRKSLLHEAKYCSQLKGINGFVVIAFGDNDASINSWQVKDGELMSLPEKTRMILAGTIHRQTYEQE